MANKEIHELPPKTNISDTSKIPFDDDLGGGVYQASSITWANVLGNAIRGFAKLASANIFTNFNTFLKQIKLISDGSASPLLVRDSTDTTTIAEITKEGYFKNTYFWQFFNLTGGGSFELYSQTSGFEVRKNGNPFMMLDVDEQKFGNINSGTSLLSIRTNNAYGGEVPLGAVLQGLGTNGSVTIYANNNAVGNKVVLAYYDGTNHRSALEYSHVASGFTIVKILRSGGQLIIGGTTPDATAVFQIDSTTQGVLLPRLTTTQRNAISGTKPVGLLVDNSTTNQLERWNGTAWQNAGKRKREVKYFMSGNIPQNTVFGGNFVELLTQREKLVKVTVVFGEQSMNTNKTIPIEIKTLDTDSVAPTATLQYTANVNAVVGAIQNKVYVFTPDVNMPSSNVLLTVNTGAFTASTQILNNCLVTLTLEEIG